MEELDRVMKRKLFISRMIGIFISFAIFAMLLLYLYKYIDEWVFGINVLVFSAMDFMINAGIVQMKQTSMWTSANTYVSALLFILGAGMVIYGLISGNLILF